MLQVMDCSATRILSSSIISSCPQPSGGFLVGRGFYSSAEMQSAYYIAPVDWVVNEYRVNSKLQDEKQMGLDVMFEFGHTD